ncbi:unnamed protein product [Clonostachys solani]|uniref:Peptidase M20 dimerisation domain-containing protein n=1 Tax=Clonostachys solani TaxID=160281 RepID=A0A9N9VXY2_9HYPO|nr:unnamed protein product [Clonostachys solani]
MICGDTRSPLVVRIGEKGLIWVKSTSSRKPVHDAHLHIGVNAIDLLLRALKAPKSLEWKLSKVNEDVKVVIETVQCILILERITVSVGSLLGGTTPNLVPDATSAAADIRIVMGISADDSVRKTYKRLDDLQGVSFRGLRSIVSWICPSEDFVKLSLEVSRSVVRPRAAVNMRVGASDSRLFRKRGIPMAVAGLTRHGMGGADEHLMAEELV